MFKTSLCNPIQNIEKKQPEPIPSIEKTVFCSERSYDGNQAIFEKSQGNQATEKQYQTVSELVIDSFTIKKVNEYMDSIETKFISDQPLKERIKNSPHRCEVCMYLSNCLFSKSTFLLNGQYKKSYGTFEIDIETLAVLNKKNDLICADMVKIGEYLVCALKEEDGKAAERSVIIIEIETQKEVFRSKSKYDFSFFTNFQCKNRILSSNSFGSVAFICAEGNSICHLNFDSKLGKVTNENIIPIKNASQVILTHLSIFCISKEGVLTKINTKSNSRTDSNWCPDPQMGDDFIFTSIAAGRKCIALSALSKKSKKLCITLLNSSGSVCLDTHYMSDRDRVYPVYQMQIVRKGATDHILATELYERVTILAVVNSALRPLQEREYHFSEMITGINFFEKERSKFAILMGASKFYCWEV